MYFPCASTLKLRPCSPSPRLSLDYRSNLQSAPFVYIVYNIPLISIDLWYKSNLFLPFIFHSLNLAHVSHSFIPHFAFCPFFQGFRRIQMVTHPTIEYSNREPRVSRLPSSFFSYFKDGANNSQHENGNHEHVPNAAAEGKT